MLIGRAEQFKMSSNHFLAEGKVDAPTVAAENASFFQYKLSVLETFCLAIVMISALLLQLNPILKSSLASVLLIITATVSWLTPVSGFAYIAAAQILPIPADSLINPAQIGFITWLVVTPFRYRRLCLQHWKIVLVYLPFLVWFVILTGQNIFLLNGEYAKVVFYIIIALQLANEAKGQYMKCLLGLCCGCLTVAFGYWAHQLGLPVTLSKFGGSRSGFFRLGGVRSDSVMVWPPMLMGSFGILGSILSFFFYSSNKQETSRYIWLLAIFIIFVTVPCLMATMTHAAFSGFVLMVVFFVSLYLAPQNNILISESNRRQIQKMLVVIFLLICSMFILNSFRISERLSALSMFYGKQSKGLGIAASRTDVWNQAIQIIIDYPFLGLFGNNVIDPETTSHSKVAGGYLAHNVFLDYAVQVGIPGMLMLAGAFGAPIIILVRRRIPFAYFAGFLCFFFACLIFWMTLSFQFYKTFWAFWMLFCLAALSWKMQASPGMR